MLVGRQHELMVLGPSADPDVYQATIFSCGAALALVVWDAFITLDDEVDHIWSKPGRTHVKWIYLFSRWYGLMNQIGFHIWYSLLAIYCPVPAPTCEMFYIYQTVTFQLLKMCLDAILILRIWAIYQRRRRYIVTAFVLIFFEILAVIVTQAIFVPKSVVDDRCLMLQIPIASSCMGISIMISQSALLSLTYCGKLFMQPAARRSKIVAVVVRDGLIVFGVSVGVVLTTIFYLRFKPVVINLFFPWIPVGPALLTPRMILNMQMAAEPTESMPEFTTHLGTIPNNGMQPASRSEEATIHESCRNSS